MKVAFDSSPLTRAAVQFLTSPQKTAGNVRNVSKTFMGLTMSTEVQFGAGDTCEFGRIKERQGWGLAVGCITDHVGPHYILRIASVWNNRSIFFTALSVNVVST